MFFDGGLGDKLIAVGWVALLIKREKRYPKSDIAVPKELYYKFCIYLPLLPLLLIFRELYSVFASTRGGCGSTFLGTLVRE
jgi:hypothetical protein